MKFGKIVTKSHTSSYAPGYPMRYLMAVSSVKYRMVFDVANGEIRLYRLGRQGYKPKNELIKLVLIEQIEV